MAGGRGGRFCIRSHASGANTERTNTTVSAYVQPIAEGYLESLERGLAGRGHRGQLYIMQLESAGVQSPLPATKAIPITVESGPASGLRERPNLAASSASPTSWRSISAVRPPNAR